ncbi:MAG: hypothetical protein IKN00_04060 [Bacteroidales bacterium]|nr:hypothetical protein [Bacteroidales bacterium]
MKDTMTLGVFYFEFAPPCSMETFRGLAREMRIPRVPGTLPYEYAVDDLRRVAERAEQRKRKSRYTI